MLSRLLALENPDDFATVEAGDIEAARQALGLTPSAFAAHLGWSARKYARVLGGAADGFVDRDFALAARGLLGLLAGATGSSVGSILDVGFPQWTSDSARTFARGRTYPDVIQRVSDEAGPWTAEVLPPLFRLVARTAARKETITYGEAATTLEENRLAKRVWPRTLYGMPLGGICNAAMALSVRTRIRVPLLSAIVVTANGVPGDGINGMVQKFIKQHETGPDQKRLLTRLKKDRGGLVEELQQEVFDFRDWPGVLRALEIERA